MKPKPISTTLKLWRQRKNLSQSEAAKRLGANLRTLQDWEQGRRTPRGFAKAALLKLINADKMAKKVRF